MLVNFIAKKVNLKDNFKEMVQKKLAKFDRLFGENAVATVKATVERNRQTVEITINDNGMIYRSENTSAEMNEAVDKCVAILGRQIRKNKTRLERRLREGSLDEFIAAEPDENEDSEAVEYDVYRTKTVPLKPMLVDEAILRMNMVGHQFFMFNNADTGMINVVYKRADGKYGLLAPEDD